MESPQLFHLEEEDDTDEIFPTPEAKHHIQYPMEEEAMATPSSIRHDQMRIRKRKTHGKMINNKSNISHRQDKTHNGHN
jgi:hypothetical protein